MEKLRENIKIKAAPSRTKRIKIRYLAIALALVGLTCLASEFVEAAGCSSLRIVFARGSGGELNNDPNYLAYKSTIEKKLKTIDLDYEFIDLDYPAIGVGVDNLGVTVGAYVGAGDAYEFGDSVNTGVDKLAALINSSCPNTRYVIGGYSQGAMVISKALPKLNANKILYAATFGDPKIYLPEGKGPSPAACRGENLSDYRAYVPDCQAYKGLLGGYVPYRPDSLKGKVGTWCNKRDVFCSSYFNIGHHLNYILDDLYEDASKIIFDKITKHFVLKNTVTSPHDTVIMIDSTGSMADLIDTYKAEALRLSEQTLNSGGRVALYDYRDLDDPYQPIEHCNFETCTIEKIQTALNNITVDGGGDDAESLLSAAFRAMKSLTWKYGATKSLVVLTDSNFLSPDRDGVSIDEVIKLSKKIDPVNFYIITEPEMEGYYNELANGTDGKIVTNLGELDLLTDYIMERYDSLPRVEETNVRNLPEIQIEKVEKLENSDVRISFKNIGGEQTVVALNDKVLGLTSENELTIHGLDLEKENIITLAPLAGDLRGESVSINLSAEKTIEDTEAPDSPHEVYLEIKKEEKILPKAPNTGRR